MISLLMISNSFSLFSNFWGSFWAHQLHPHHTLKLIFICCCSLARFKYLSIFFNFFGGGSLCNPPKEQKSQVFLFLVNWHQGWSSGRDYAIHLYLKIPENLIRLILSDGFRLVHIPFGSIFRLKFIEQFRVDHLSHPVVPSLIHFLS